jgi:O-antigen ligase
MSLHSSFRRADVWLPTLWILGLPSFILLAGRILPSIPVFKPDRVAFLIALLPLILLAWRTPKQLQRPGLIEAAMLAVLVVLIASWATTIAGKPRLVLKQDADFLLTCFVMPYAAFLMARNTDWTEERVSACLWVLTAGLGTYFLLFGLVQSTMDWNFLVSHSILQHPDRAKGPFDNAAPFGLVVVMLIVLTLLVFLQARRRSRQLLLIAIAVGLAQSLVASKTRAAWLALPFGLLLPFVCYRKTRWLAAILVADVALQVFVVPALPARLQHRAPVASERSSSQPSAEPTATPPDDYLGLQERLVEEEPLYDRAAVTRVALQMIRTHPLFGLGFGLWTFQSHKAEYYGGLGADATYAVYPNNAHNDILNVLVLAGAVGAAVYALLLFAIVRLLWQRYKYSPSPLVRELAVFVGALFVVLIVGAQFHSVIAMAYLQVLSFYFLGIVAHAHDQVAAGADRRGHHDALVTS